MPAPLLRVILGTLAVAGLIGIVLAPVVFGGGCVVSGKVNAEMQTTRMIALLLFSYADNHHGAYPTGASSTEVFQKLIDEGYCTDPTIFYLPLPGKTKPVFGQKLKPENVGFDVTADVTAADSDYLPLVFGTGCRLVYVPQGAAILTAPYYAPRMWRDWGTTEVEAWPIATKGNNAIAFNLISECRTARKIPNAVSANFDPHGKTYRQLTPDGPLP